MKITRLLINFLVFVSLGCSEDLGPGKFGANPLSPQSPGVEGSWNLKSDFQLIPGSESVGHAVGVDRVGNWFSVGYGISFGVKSWLVRKSSDFGASWSLVDTFNYNTNLEAVARGVASDTSGNIFVVGHGVGNAGSPQYYWLVRKSNDGGLSWTTVDALTGAPGLYSEAAAVTVSSTGRIYVVGTTHDGTKFQWIVRTSSNGGSSWSTVSTYNYPSSTNHARAYAVAVDGNGVVFVSGSAQDTSGKFHWIVQRSADNGATWTTVDDYQMESSQDSESRGLAIDSQGRVFSSGYGFSLLTGQRWILRRAQSSEGPWSTVDNYVHPSDSPTQALSSARSVAVDSKNNIYVAGFASTFVGSQKSIAIVRKSSDGGNTWTLADSHQAVSNDTDAAAYSIAIDPADRLFVTGSSWIGSLAWFIRANP